MLLKYFKKGLQYILEDGGFLLYTRTSFMYSCLCITFITFILCDYIVVLDILWSRWDLLVKLISLV